MSITSDRIREQGFFHALADDAADEIDALEKENAKLRTLIELIFSSTLPYNGEEATFSDAVTDMWKELKELTEEERQNAEF
ncbi:MAG: hypothetical protein IPL32_17585 [Chloracidobacterium sp.]|nr:hypothetical protein [Chloracidobacterium sp.]